MTQIGNDRIFRWLAIAGAADWLLARTLSRSAVFMPKSPAILGAYRGMIALGQFAANAASLLALAVMIWISIRRLYAGQRALPLALLALTCINTVSLLIAPPAALTLGFQLIAIAALLMLVHLAIKRSLELAQAAATLLPAAALLAAAVHQAAANLPAVLPAERPFGIGMLAFNAGEALVVASGFALGWWMQPRRSEPWIWLVAALPAIVFSSLYLAAPAVSGVLAIWSLGLTLFLPWSLYALSLWAGTAALLSALRRKHPAGVAITLLVAGGYAAQLSSYLFLGLIALYVLADEGVPKEFERARSPRGQRHGEAPLPIPTGG